MRKEILEIFLDEHWHLYNDFGEREREREREREILVASIICVAVCLSVCVCVFGREIV